jgi:hypothetical protein
MLLFLLLKGFDVSGAERVATTALALIFFWGAFHFISTVRGHAAYWLAPWLTILLSYGIAFQVVQMNYYLSCGVAFSVICHLMAAALAWWTLWATPLLHPSYLALLCPSFGFCAWRPIAGLLCGCGFNFSFFFFRVAWSFSF